MRKEFSQKVVSMDGIESVVPLVMKTGSDRRAEKGKNALTVQPVCASLQGFVVEPFDEVCET